MIIAPNCNRCTLSKTRNMVVHPELPPTMKVLFIGRDPGAVEDRLGTPLHPDAPAGGLLRKLIADVGIPHEWCGFDNMVHCHTVDNKGPKKEEVNACRVWHRMVMGQLVPSCIVVLLGQEATEAYVNPLDYRPKKPMFPIGEQFNIREGVYCVPHPSAALRNGAQRRELRRRLKMVAEVLGVFRPEPDFDLCPVDHSGAVAVDVETSMADGSLLGVGLAWRVGLRCCAMWVPIERVAELEDLLLSARKVIMHNARFDLKVLSTAGITVKCEVEDTYVMAHVLRRDQFVGGLGLKELALADLGVQWDGLDELGPPEELEQEVLQHYCLCDCVATLMLHQKYEEML